MSAAGNNSEENSADFNNVHSTNQVQINQFAQPVQSYWIPGNNNMGSSCMPHGFYGYVPVTIYDMSAMMPTSLMPMGSSNLYNAPAHQNYQPYLPIQQFQPQMFMPQSSTPMIFYNPMFAGNQHLMVNSNHTANSTSVQDSVQRSMNNGISENPPLIDTLSEVTSSQSPIDNADPSRTCQTQSSGQNPVSKLSSNGVSQNSISTETALEITEDAINDPATASSTTPLPMKDMSFFETEKSLSKEATPEATNGQIFVNNPNSSGTCEKQSEQDVVPPPISVSPSTSSPKTLNCSTNALPNRASECSMPALVTRSSAAFPSSVLADATKNKQKRRFAQCHCPNCKTDGDNKPRFPNGCLKHICHFRDCGRVFHRPAHLKKHIKWHDGKEYFCAWCSQGFARKIDLSAHIETREKSASSDCQSLDSKSSKNSNSRGRYVCNIPNCGKVYAYRWVLQRHLRWHDNNKKNFICQYCNKEYGRQGMLTSHLKNVHTSKPSEPTRANFNGRPLSSYSVREASPQEIDINFDLESTTSKHACQFAKCGKVYVSFNRLKEHTKSHFGAAPYVCRWPSCGKEFTRASYLQAHQVGHTNEKK